MLTRIHLHSTLFILKQVLLKKWEQYKYHLHSTLFILKLCEYTYSCEHKCKFTFHSVYIKTLEPKTFNYQGSKILFLSMLQKIIINRINLLLEIIYILVLHALEVLSIPPKFYSIGGRQKKAKRSLMFYRLPFPRILFASISLLCF